MPRTIDCLTLSLALLTCAGAASAQTATNTNTTGQTAAPSQPPVTERIEAGSDEPTTPIVPQRGTRITEKRSNNGEVTEVEVQSGKSRYIMRPNQPAGNAQRGDAQSSAIRAPQWKVMEFDLGGAKKAKTEAEIAAAAAAANTPASGKPAGQVPAATVPMTKPADIPPPPPMPATR